MLCKKLKSVHNQKKVWSCVEPFLNTPTPLNTRMRGQFHERRRSLDRHKVAVRHLRNGKWITVTSVWVKCCSQSLSWKADLTLFIWLQETHWRFTPSLHASVTFNCLFPPPHCQVVRLPLHAHAAATTCHHSDTTSGWHLCDPFPHTLPWNHLPPRPLRPTMALSSRLKLWEQKGGAELLHAALIGHLIFGLDCMCVLCSRTSHWLHAWIVRACHCEVLLLLY